MPSQFFIQRNGKVIGPLSPDAVKDRIGTGKIRATDQLGKASNGPWKTIADFPAWAKLFESESADDPFDAYGDDAYGDDAYGDDAYGDDAYGLDAYVGEASQLPPQRRKKKKTPAIVERNTKKQTSKPLSKIGRLGYILGYVYLLFLCAGATFSILDNSGAFDSGETRRLQAELAEMNADYEDNYASNARGANEALQGLSGTGGGLIGALGDLKTEATIANRQADFARDRSERQQTKNEFSDKRSTYLVRSFFGLLFAVAALVFLTIRLRRRKADFWLSHILDRLLPSQR